MINNYEIFRINENVNLSFDEIVDIIMSLDYKKYKHIIDKIINKKEKDGKTFLMKVIEKNNIDHINYILTFNPDIHAITVLKENVLFFCKSLTAFNIFYNLGVNVKQINHLNMNVMMSLASKRIYDVDTYQKLMRDGIDINLISVNNYDCLTYSIEVKKMVLFFIKNNINLNKNDKVQNNYLSHLLHKYEYWPKHRQKITDILILLFQNGLKIIDNRFFVDCVDNLRYNDKGVSMELIDKIRKYFTDDMMLLYVNKLFFNIWLYKEDEILNHIKWIFKDNSHYIKVYERLMQMFNDKNRYKEILDYLSSYTIYGAVKKYNL
jgi:hypothetical protein